MKHPILTILLYCIISLTGTVYAQTTLKGKVVDEQGSPLIGASVQIEGTVTGTITDANGNFEFATSRSQPLTLIISYVGYFKETVTYTGSELSITMKSDVQTLKAVTVSAASRVDESILEAPVTIEKLTLSDLRSSPTLDAYSAIGTMKGVQTNDGSLTFSSVNTRGFADMQNWRFVQLIDGMDASAPGLNYPIGGLSGPADIDIASIELVPGANSALYGANAFNGLLTINTKDPFYYQGLSAYVRTGVTVQDAGGTNPLTDFGFRYAKSYKDKFAFKINAGYFTATDWTANDESFYIDNTTATAATEDQIAALLNTPRNDPNFNAVNIYGDEVVATVDLDGDGTPETPINRTGIAEADIVDYDTYTFKTDATLSYRLTENLEASYSYRYIESNAILRHTTIYPLRGFNQQFHNLRLKGSNWDVQAFTSKENAGDSYAMLVTGGFIEQGRRSNEDWAALYGAAYQSNGGNHDAARIAADAGMPAPGSAQFNALRDASLSNSDITTGGSKFVDNSSLSSLSGNYQFTAIKNVVDLQTGFRYRRFKLDSEGQLFNDGPQGFNEPIPVEEYGGYLQAGKKLANDRINLRASLRYDKHQDFEGKLTPRLSGVFQLDQEKNHFLRASYQTGFRNAASQEGYINLDIGSAILLGGIENNLENLTAMTAAGPVDGKTLHSELVTIASFGAFQASGDPTVLQRADLPFLVQEKNSTWEIGYKGIIGGKLFVDLNYYNTTYQDLIVRLTTVSLLTGRAYLVYTNIEDDVTSNGIGAQFDYVLGKGYKAGINYTYTNFDADEAVRNEPGFLPSFNTPENRVNLSFSGSGVGGTELGFNLKVRYWDDYVWQSPFGRGDIESQTLVDLALTYNIRNLQSQVKLGATNLFNSEYRTVYGGPNIGSIYAITWTFDQALVR